MGLLHSISHQNNQKRTLFHMNLTAQYLNWFFLSPVSCNNLAEVHYSYSHNRVMVNTSIKASLQSLKMYIQVKQCFRPKFSQTCIVCISLAG